MSLLVPRRMAGSSNGTGGPTPSPASSATTGDDPEKSHMFGAVNVVLLCFIIGLCILASYLIKKFRCYRVPESAAAMVIGIIVGGIARLANPSAEEMEVLSFQPELFFFLLLPPIIFEAGYTLNKKGFFSNFTTIALYAVVGTLISTLVVGFLSYAVASAGWVQLDDHSPMEALLFGALISAVDPVATLSIMGNEDIAADPTLYSLIFGESVLNDAVAIVLFKTIAGFDRPDAGEFTWGTVGGVFGTFIGVSLGSSLLGVAVGLLCSRLMRITRLKDHPKYELTLLFLFSFGCYALAESIAWEGGSMSGIMALFFCGITLSHYNFFNLSEASQGASAYVFETLASISETLVFVYMGTTVFTGSLQYWDVGFIFLSIVFCLLGRALNTFPLSWCANLRRKRKVPLKMQFLIWFAGLRGAIAFALASTMTTKNHHVIVTTTMTIVMLTTFLCGSMTEPLLTRLDLKKQRRTRSIRVDSVDHGHDRLLDSAGGLGSEDDDDDDPNNPYALVNTQDATDGSSRIHIVSRNSNRRVTGLHGFWKRVDNQWMKPVFGGEPPTPFNRNGAGAGGRQGGRDEKSFDGDELNMMAERMGGVNAPHSPGMGSSSSSTGSAAGGGGGGAGQRSSPGGAAGGGDAGLKPRMLTSSMGLASPMSPLGSPKERGPGAAIVPADDTFQLSESRDAASVGVTVEAVALEGAQSHDADDDADSRYRPPHEQS